MRIRKRQVPLPFSSISPAPLSSDPNFNRSSPVVVQLPLQQQQQHPPPLPTPCFDHRYPSESDHPSHPIGQRLQAQGRDSSAFHGTTTTAPLHGQELMKKKQDYLVLKQVAAAEEEEEEGEKSNDTGKKSVLGAELGTGSFSQWSSSHQAVGKWGEGEKAFPLKKRRGSVGNDEDDTIMEKDTYKRGKINTNKMKTKLNKKFVQHQNSNEQEEIIKESKNGSTACGSNVDNNNYPSGAKKRGGRGGALMEGSRCSRVNGRGWRCCQQTLVGYSLCEHHLGKGRLRSMNSVRSRSLASSTSSSNAAKEEEQQKQRNNNDHQSQIVSNRSSQSQQAKQTKRELVGESGENMDRDQGEDQKPLMTTKKKVKLGMVKARSISSLLGQNDNAIAAADDNN